MVRGLSKMKTRMANVVIPLPLKITGIQRGDYCPSVISYKPCPVLDVFVHGVSVYECNRRARIFHGQGVQKGVSRRNPLIEKNKNKSN